MVPGHFRSDSELQFMVIDRGQPRPDGERDPATLLLYDLHGRELWRRRQPEGAWAAAAEKASWSGPGAPDAMLVYNRGKVVEIRRGEEILYGYQQDHPEAIYDGDGNILDNFTMRYPSEPSSHDLRYGYYATAADVWGDSRDEVILFGTRGACIHANARPLALPTLYNETVYQGM